MSMPRRTGTVSEATGAMMWGAIDKRRSQAALARADPPPFFFFSHDRSFRVVELQSDVSRHI
jgi:hypothetical protein